MESSPLSKADAPSEEPMCRARFASRQTRRRLALGARGDKVSFGRHVKSAIVRITAGLRVEAGQPVAVAILHGKMALTLRVGEAGRATGPEWAFRARRAPGFTSRG